MKTNKRFLLAVAFATLALTFFACSSGEDVDGNQPSNGSSALYTCQLSTGCIQATISDCSQIGGYVVAVCQESSSSSNSNNSNVPLSSSSIPSSSSLAFSCPAGTQPLCDGANYYYQGCPGYISGNGVAVCQPQSSSSSLPSSSSIATLSSSSSLPSYSSSVPSSSSSIRSSSSAASSSSSTVSSSSIALSSVTQSSSSFSCPSGVVCSTMTDRRDNKTYRTVKIATQTWMAENLNYIPATGNFPATGNSWCYEGDDYSTDPKTTLSGTQGCAKYGRLYDWATANAVCPSNWRLPTDGDWDTLINNVGGYNTAGKYLKSTSGWINNGNGLDTYGFSALPGGLRYTGGSFGSGGWWWSATEYAAGSARSRAMHNGDVVNRDNAAEAAGFSVRCLQN